MKDLTDEEKLKLEDFVKAIYGVWPFKRIVAPAYLVKRWNDEYGSSTNQDLQGFAFNVDKEAPVTEELIWNAMTYTQKNPDKVKPLDFGDSSHGNPTHTGMLKKQLID